MTMKLRLALLLFGFICGLCVPRAEVRAQDATPPIDVAAHASADLTLKDVIEMLAEFEVRHADQQPFFKPTYGAVNFDVYPPAIWIFNVSDNEAKKSTVVHELKHIQYHKLGVDPPEPIVLAEEEREYRRIFGLP